MAFLGFFDVIFAPLFKLPLLLAIIILSFLISIIIILITKYTTNQALMKTLKDDIKEYQKQIKSLRSEPAKAMEMQKKTMELNMKYMMHSLKPTIITFIPIIIIFTWMSSNFAYESIKPQQEFSITAIFQKGTTGKLELIVPEGVAIIGDETKNIEDGKATWTLKGEEGEHILEFLYNNQKYQKSILITNTKKYIEPLKKIDDNELKAIQIDYKSIKILNLFGWRLGWLGTYILFSIVFTMALRKIMKVY